ncbi:glycoside hydrolase family 3 C-terminal domain-containing protein [Actinoplanes sp. NPDC049548]|uniref:glycoside hydrolase family 3 C-terminal domain-containing protein n=1 Tax=Actinoplanes sp. NPDC049548 TaxID=3155152 RepID=UPI00343FCEF8
MTTASDQVVAPAAAWACDMTVLRNEGGVLPLDPSATVALIGRHSVETFAMGGDPVQAHLGERLTLADGLGPARHEASRETVEAIDDAVRAAALADVTVILVGPEEEAADERALHLPGTQNALVDAVAGAARHTVVVVRAATPVFMPWRDRVDAVLWTGPPGPGAGHDVAAALLGTVEPAGRLTTTFPADDGRHPPRPFPAARAHLDGRKPEPAYWLGHGLGYGRWEYADARVIGGDSPGVGVTVTNVGDRESREVVQVYHQPADRDEPVRLTGWAAVTVAPGESARVMVATDARDGELLIARGLGDIRASLPLD